MVYRGAAGELPLDLFAVTGPAQWGVILTVRTGPGAFSTRLVTARRYGGGMPEGFRVRDGALWDGERLVATPEEADLFAALGLPWLPPSGAPTPCAPSAGTGSGGGTIPPRPELLAREGPPVGPSRSAERGACRGAGARARLPGHPRHSDPRRGRRPGRRRRTP
ncbi:MAG TPA: hypothetical protein VH257_17170, partial [Chloroflexota bacterium]|nr:hypothetical protein [Chloroflexota bacterium]